jgi:hypothetical protein
MLEGRPQEEVDDSVCAILLKNDGNGGVRVFRREGDENIVPKKDEGWHLILIQPDDRARILGIPVLRYFTLNLTSEC